MRHLGAQSTACNYDTVLMWTLRCRVDVSLKRFKDTVHVGMNVPSISARDTKLALALIRAHWEHACDTEAQQQAAEEKSAAKL